MNFHQIVEATRKLCAEKGVTHMCDWALHNLTEQINASSQANWGAVDIAAPQCDVESLVPCLFSRFRETLQLIGMSMTNGHPNHDEAVWEELTEVQVAFRQVLTDNYHVELPEARVVSMVEELVQSGALEQVEGENGEMCVRPKTVACEFQIRIVKVPGGPAPQEIREKWVGLVLPAFQPTGHLEHYAVPISVGLEALDKVSPEGVDWFAQHFGLTGDFHFSVSDAEVVAQ